MNNIKVTNLEEFESEVRNMFNELRSIMLSGKKESDNVSRYPFFQDLDRDDGMFLIHLGEYLEKFSSKNNSNSPEENQHSYIWIIGRLFEETFPTLVYSIEYVKEIDLWLLKYRLSATISDNAGMVTPKVTIYYDGESYTPLEKRIPDITCQINAYDAKITINLLRGVFGRAYYLNDFYEKIILNMMRYLISLMKTNLS